MRKPQFVIGVALIGLLAAVLVFLLQSTSDDGSNIDPIVARAPEPGPEPEKPVVAEKAPDREAVAAAPQAIEPESGPPAAYAKHLGGVIGRLVEPDGRVVPNTRIDAITITIEEIFPQLDSLFAEAPIDFDEVKATTKTKEDGTFRFDKLEPRAIYVLGIDPNGPRATIRMVDRPPNSGEVTDLGDVVLEPFVTFTGRVADESGTPIADARVRASNLPKLLFGFGVQDLRPGFSVAFQENFRGNEEWRVAKVPSFAFRLLDKIPLPTTKTFEDGTFKLEGVPLGQVTVLVDHVGYVSLVHGPVATGNEGEKNIGTLTLDDGETLVGMVVDGADKPIADAEVLAGPVQDLAPVALMVPVGKTDANGRFEAKGLSDKDHAVAARTKTGVEWTLVQGVMPGYDEAKVVLADTYQVEVHAFASGGDQLPRPQLVVQKINELPLHPLLVPPIPLAGRLSYQEGGGAIVGDLAKGKYSLLVRAPGYAASQVEADLSEGSTSVVAQLEKEFTTTVKVVAKGDGQPVVWATVGLFSDSKERQDRDTRAIPLANKRTGEDGIVKVNGLQKGKYKVVVLHPAYAEMIADVEVPGEPIVMELPEGGSVRGRVHEKGEPPNPDRFVGMGKNEGFPRFNVTDKDGGFHITHLAPGEYQLAVVRRFANQGIGDLAGSMQNFAPERFVKITIDEGKETVVDIDLKGLDTDLPIARLSGRVVINNGPAANIGLRFTSQQQQADGESRARDRGDFMQRMKNTVTDANGYFDFGEVLAGDGQIDVQQPGERSSFNFGRLKREKVKLAENDTKEIVIRLDVGRVRGRVLDDRTGQGLGTVEVSLNAQQPAPKEGEKSDPMREYNSGVRLQTVTDGDGAFAFEYVTAGKYDLNARRNEYAPTRVRDIDVPVNGQPPAVDVRLQTGVVVKGKVVLPASATPEKEEDGGRKWVYVSFQGIEGATGNSGAGVDTEAMTFSVDDLMPGKYQVSCWANGPQLEPITIEVPRDGLANVVLTFEPQKEKPPKAQPENAKGGGKGR